MVPGEWRPKCENDEDKEEKNEEKEAEKEEHNAELNEDRGAEQAVEVFYWTADAAAVSGLDREQSWWAQI